jgi:hypothetical protein
MSRFCESLYSNDDGSWRWIVERRLVSMPFLYRCPNTGLKVQGWVSDDPTKEEAFQPVTCTACGRVHLVNPKTGKVAGPEK